MATALACSAVAAPCARLSTSARSCISKPAARAAFLPARPARVARRAAAVQPKALAGVQEVAQLAELDAGFIFGVSGVMIAITLIGLAFGFVLLRVESLAEEGKI